MFLNTLPYILHCVLREISIKNIIRDFIFSYEPERYLIIFNENRVIQVSEEDEVEDPYCLEERPIKLTFEDITSAAYKIKDGVLKSACTVSCFIIFSLPK